MLAIAKYVADFISLVVHSQKQSAHWAVDMTAQVVQC